MFHRSTKSRWTILFSTFIILFFVLHHIQSLEFSRLFLNPDEPDLINPDNVESENAEVPPVTEPASAPEIVIEMSDRVPSFKLATKSGEKPASASERAQTRFLGELRLLETCQQNPSTIVVDVGAGLGAFGLYAAACGCTVYMFEVQTELITLIRSSLNHNSFSSPPVNIFHNAVSDLPPETVVKYPPGDGDNSVSVQTIRLDDIPWSSTSIYALKIDVEGSELSVLRSARTLLIEKRVRHLFFKYSPWLGDQALQKTLLPYVRKELKAKFVYSLYPNDDKLYGPMVPVHFAALTDKLLQSQKDTSIYAIFDVAVTASSINSQPFRSNDIP